MPSPDITPYVDLTIYDQQPDELYDAALDYARVAIPEWTPRAGTIEDALLQAAAGVSGELLAALNRVPSSVFEALLKLFGIERQTGTAATAEVRINLIDDLGHTIPAGTRFGWLDPNETEQTLYVFETTELITVAAPDDYVDVTLSGILLQQYPNLETGTVLRLLSGISFIEDAELLQDLEIGSIGETDAEYFTRAAAALNSYTQSLVLPDQFESYVLSNYSNVYRAKAYNLLDPADPEIATFAETPGYLTIYASGVDGASLTTESASAIVEDLQSKSVGGLVINVDPPTLVNINVTATVLVKVGYVGTTVVSNTETAISEYLGPNSWSWGETIYYNEMVALLDRVDGVERVVSLSLGVPSGGATVDGDDINFTNFGSLPVATSLITGQAY